MAQVEMTKLRAWLEADPRPNYVIAAACGIHPSVLSFYANGTRSFSAKHLQRLAKEFGCDESDLTGIYVFTIG